MSLVQTTPPEVAPVTVEEVKAHLRIDTADEDTLLAAYINAAVGVAERTLRRQLITAEWVESFDAFPANGILRLSRPPLQSVEAVNYVDPEGTELTLDEHLYTVDAASQPGRVVLAYGESWPETLRRPDAVTVEFTAGYGDEPENVPGDFRLALLYLVGHYYKLREPVVTGTTATPIPLTVESLLSNRAYQFA